ncbi:MAG: S49 family peptidase [Proteobacteria bacterium]|nr:MAG: S49 family peptidase [Pseudomonadota bacterium]
MSEQNKPSWEQETIQKVLLETIKEQRRARRWRIFFRLVVIIVIVIGVWQALGNSDELDEGKKGPQVAVVDFNGVISDETQNYKTVIKGVTAALKDKKTVAVIIRANSPGGSPVYSDIMNTELTRLRKLYPNKPIDVVVEEVCASGCYYASAAANKIYANPSSIVGSIGVIYTGFGATEAMKKLGVDSRLLISGKNKAMGYPFLPENKEQTAMQQQMLDEVHQLFIDAVKRGRGAKLANDPDLFSGRYWIGQDALKLGLIDGYGSVASVARDQYKSENLVDFTPAQDPLDKLTKKLGVTMVDSAKQAVIGSGLSGNMN